ncbi:hypothetical protein BC351_38810 [Paenibacillus ferrarius]|uniref:Uncharacterized protein n=1 Tax=Paenibacillus ferrarius TaxID=1469647 RepID=A0A1V4H9L0_9BACL|nr:hypothetical protein [Paenibacillus ferrarius]OPH48129.1 hypothetical protein BC351_38810 [Paenibacillus ferrarius]
MTWNPYWYDLDQTVIVGDVDYFYLDKDEKSFANGGASDDDKEVRAEILRVIHPELGEVLGILANGLSYKIYFSDSKFIQVDSEEKPGWIEYPENYKVNDWVFDVEINVLEVTGFTSLMR